MNYKELLKSELLPAFVAPNPLHLHLLHPKFVKCWEKFRNISKFLAVEI